VADAANKIIQEHLALNQEKLSEAAATKMLGLAFGAETPPEDGAGGMHAAFQRVAGADGQIGADVLPALFSRTQVHVVRMYLVVLSYSAGLKGIYEQLVKGRDFPPGEVTPYRSPILPAILWGTPPPPPPRALPTATTHLLPLPFPRMPPNQVCLRLKNRLGGHRCSWAWPAKPLAVILSWAFPAPLPPTPPPSSRGGTN